MSKKITVKDLLGQPCRYCQVVVVDESIGAITRSYWQGHPFISHKDCKKYGETLEAYDCQIIDADCNDCYFFRRESISPNNKEIWSGFCLKFQIKTRAFPKFCTGKSCFEHRREPKFNPLDGRPTAGPPPPPTQ